MKKSIGIFVVLCLCLSCINTPSQQSVPAYYSGTYVFSQFESMTLGVWLRADSSFIMVKKADNDSLFSGTAGKWNRKGDIIQLNSGNEGRLVAKYADGQLEVMNNEGEPISRESKFMLAKVSGILPDDLRFSAKAKLISVGENGLAFQFCNLDLPWKVSDEHAEIVHSMHKSTVSGDYFEWLIVIEPDNGSGNKVRIISISSQTAWDDCDQ